MLSTLSTGSLTPGARTSWQKVSISLPHWVKVRIHFPHCLIGVCCGFAFVKFLLRLYTQVQFVIPNTSLGSVLQHFQGITPNQDHFSLIEAPLHAFIETEFIKTFIKDGNLLLILGKYLLANILLV